MKPIIRYSGSPGSDPADWQRINYLRHEPDETTGYKITIEEIVPPQAKPTLYPFDLDRALAGETVVTASGRESSSVNLSRFRKNYPLEVYWRDGGISVYTQDGRELKADATPSLFMLNPPKQ